MAVGGGARQQGRRDPMNKLTVVLVTALVTGVVSVSGIWLGSHLTGENEDRKWRRDHALEAYSELIRAVEAVRNAADISYFVEDCGTEKHAKQNGIVADKLAELLRVVQSVLLTRLCLRPTRRVYCLSHSGGLGSFCNA
jgi:hypothetical protein